MEGTQGITIEVRTPSLPSSPKNTEQGTSAVQSVNHEEKASLSTEKSQDTQNENNEKRAKTDEEILAEKKNELREEFEQLEENIDEKTRGELLEDYLAEYLSEDKQKEKGKKLVDTLKEIMRLVKILFALIALQIRYPDRDKFSGKELNFSDSPPEGNDNDPLTKLLYGKDAKESWKDFKEEVEAIENVSFSELMKGVLAANEKHSIKTHNVKEEDKNDFLKRSFRNGKNLPGRAVSARRAA